MKKSIHVLILSTLAIFTMSCDEETLSALQEAVSAIIAPVPGCVNADNDNFNPLATEHVQDSCAVQSYGCTDTTAVNYNISATNMCAGIPENQCCTATVSGCTDENYENYNEDANNDDGSCSGTIDFGCMTPSACNYNSNATSDCNQVAAGPNTNCCEQPDSLSVVCVRDFDNDGYQDEGTDSNTLGSGNCGCETLGYGWMDQENTNGEAVWGCLDPSCPEFATQCASAEGCANVNDGNCCLEFSADDSLFMFGEDYENCAADTDGDGLPNVENCIQTDDFNLLGGYFVDFGDCEGGGGDPQEDVDSYDELYINLGHYGQYFEKYLSIKEIGGYRVPPVYLPSYDSPADCETYAAGSNWYCGNQMADAEIYRPCQEEYFEGQCNQRDECWWEAPECRWNTSQWVGDACFDDANMSNQNACTADPGCQWNQQWGDCYFDCWGLDEATCNNAALGEECWWKTPDSNGGFCSAPANNHSQCNAQGASAGAGEAV